MSEKKYGKYIVRNPYKKASNAEVVEPMVHLNGEKDGGGANLTVSRSWITQPLRMIKEAHYHDRDQFLMFMGGNPLDVNDFGAEVELFLGEEGESQIIDCPALVHIPAGLKHGPLVYNRVDRPIVFLDIYLAPVYERK
jgi:hypothetical protein